MSDEKYDVIVIGSGPGGYVAAIRCAQLGMKTACVEMRDTLGGTCLNIGCIPSKALLVASEKYAEAAHHLGSFGVKVDKVSLDMKGMMKHKDEVVEANTKGIEFLFKKNKVDWLHGKGKILGPGRVEVAPGGRKKKTVYETESIIVATGSTHTDLPGIEIDEKKIVSSTGALDLPKVPKSLVVIGGGYIGLEMGAVWGRLGAKVTVVEFLDRITPGMDGEVSKQFQRILEKQGFEFKLGTKVTEAKSTKTGVSLTVEPAAGGDAETLKADVVLVSTGRKPYTDGLGLEEAGIKTDARGFVTVDEFFQTNLDDVYAIGDCIRGAMLAHKAEEEGVVLAEMLAGQQPHIDYDAIPGVIYTEPEVASVGKTEEQLKEAGTPYKVGKFPFTANGRARANNATDGFVKVLSHAETDRVLGCHIIGQQAGTMISELVLCMEFEGTAEDIFRSVHAHPTLNEAVKEAALATDKRPIHM